jgi:hypothetical protein
MARSPGGHPALAMLARRLALPLLLLTACDIHSTVGYDDAESGLAGRSCGDAGIARCDSGLCAVTSVFAPPAGSITLAADEASLYFMADPNTLDRYTLRDGTSAFLATADSTLMRMTSDAENVYWTELDGDVRGVPKSGGSRFDASYVFGNPTDIAVDSTYLYWLFPEFGQIAMAPKPSGAATFISGQDGPQAITTDDTYVYWVNAGTGVMAGQLVRAARGDLTSAAVLLSGLDSPVAIAASGGAVYWASKTAVYRLPKAGAAPETVATGFSEVKAIAVHGATLYGIGMEGLWRAPASGGAWQELELRPMSALALSCDGVYATAWYENALVKYGP